MKRSISMTMQETLLGWLLMACQLLVFPVIVSAINLVLPSPLSNTALNCLLFIGEFLLAVLIFRKFLFASLKAFFQKPLRCLLFSGAGLVIYYLGSAFVGLLISVLYPDFANANDGNIYNMLRENYSLIILCTVFLVPLTEELLYRGLIFQSLERKSTFAAYTVSICVFSLIHIIGYVGSTPWVILVLSFLQYIPAGFSLVCAYEKTNSIFTSVVMHMTVNFISISLMRYL